jgi:Type I restriction modification DNA specificity domain
VLLGEDGAPFLDKTKPIAYIISGKSWVNNHAHVLRAITGVTSNSFIKYFLDWFPFEGQVNGTTRLKLTQGAMNSIPVRLPPLSEQQRFVRSIENSTECLRKTGGRLSLARTIMKRFRQSVLAAACSGRLTADWRERHGGKRSSAEDGKNSLPTGWQNTELNEIAQVIDPNPSHRYRLTSTVPCSSWQRKIFVDSMSGTFRQPSLHPPHSTLSEKPHMDFVTTTSYLLERGAWDLRDGPRAVHVMSSATRYS